jgi:cyanate lyase
MPIELDDMSPKAAQCIKALRQMKDEQGLSYEKIGELCGVAWGTVRNALLGIRHLRHDTVKQIRRKLRLG